MCCRLHRTRSLAAVPPSRVVTTACAAFPVHAVVGPSSSGRFDNFTVDVECDLGGATSSGIARWMYSGMKLMFTCKTGFEPVGSLTWTCGGAVQQYRNASLLCLSKLPTPMPFAYAIPERSPNNTFAGAVQALPANPEQTISYDVVAQYPRSRSGKLAFIVSTCSGALRVADPDQLDFQAAPAIIVTAMAWPDTQRCVQSQALAALIAPRMHCSACC